MLSEEPIKDSENEETGEEFHLPTLFDQYHEEKIEEEFHLPTLFSQYHDDTNDANAQKSY